MKVWELLKALRENKYILLRTYDNKVLGVNCKAGLMSYKRSKLYNSYDGTRFQSFYPINFMEYISLKNPFL